MCVLAVRLKLGNEKLVISHALKRFLSCLDPVTDFQRFAIISYVQIVFDYYFAVNVGGATI